VRQPARAVDQPDEIELLGDPHQGSDIPDGAVADDLGGSQIRHRWRLSGAEDGLPSDRTTSHRIPQGL
jgi:hypothetical protein